MKNLSRLEKIGYTGVGIVSLITIILVLIDSEPIYVAPFILPWLVFIMIGRERRKGSRKQ